MHTLNLYVNINASFSKATLRQTVIMSAFGYSKSLSVKFNALQYRRTISFVKFIVFTETVRALTLFVSFFKREMCFWQYLWSALMTLEKTFYSVIMASVFLTLLSDGGLWKSGKSQTESLAQYWPQRWVGPFKIITLFCSGLGVTLLPVTSPVTI